MEIQDKPQALSSQRQAELRLVYDHVPVMICVLDAERRVLYANRALCEFVDRTDGSLEGETACGILGCINALEDPRGCGFGTSCQACPLRLAMVDTYRTGASHRGIDYRPTVLRQGRREDMAFLGSTALLSLGGQPSLVLCLEDITDYRRTEERLRLLAELLDAAPTCTTVHDREGRFLYANEQTLALHGYTRDEFLQLNLHQVDVPASAEQIAARMAEITERGWASFDVEHYRKDGSLLPLRVHAKPARWGDQDVILSVATDVTDLRRTQDALRDREARLRGILEAVSESVFLLDLEGGVLECNETTAERVGTSVAELVGKSAYDFLPAELAESRQKEIERVAETRQPVQFEDQRGGIWFENTVYPVFDQHGRVKQFAVFARDVTARKKQERQLRLQSLVLDQIQDKVTVTDLDGVIQYVNDAECASLKRSRECLIGQSVTLYGDDPDKGATQREIIRKTREDGEWRGEVINYDSDGKELVMDCRTRLVRDEAGQPLALCGIATDVTARQRAEESLRQSEEHFRVLAETMLQGVVHQRRDGTVIAMNPAAERILGTSADEFLGSNSVSQEAFTIREDGSPFPGLEHPAMQALRSGQPVKGVVMGYFNRRVAAHRWIKVDAVPLFRPGEEQPFQVYTVFEDITDRRHAEHESRDLERRLLQTQKFESLGIMAGGIAHDFNNILAAIGGYAELVQASLPPAAPEQDDLKVIRQSVDRATELTRQMLAYSGKGKFVIEPVNLSQLVAECQGLLATCISKRAAVTYNLPCDLPSIEADPAQLRQLLLNLVINASEALGEETGRITISTRPVQATAEELAGLTLGRDVPAGLYVCLEVADTGCGMDDQTLAKIFDPFFTTKFTGRGLGAAAVHGIVRGHQGAIGITSQPGRGTIFQVLFPARGPGVAVGAGGSEAPARQAGGTILVADDEEMVRNLARRLIERAGFSVLTAADGAQAVQLYRQHQAEIALVLLDLTMPRMDGQEAFRELRRISPSVRVVVSSGYSEEDATERFAGLGLTGFIRKPYQHGELIAALKKALDSD